MGGLGEVAQPVYCLADRPSLHDFAQASSAAKAMKAM